MRHIIILLFVWPCLLPAQPGFNKTYDFGFPRNQFRNILVHQDTIIGYGIARVDTPPYQQCLFLARFDSSGLPIDNVLICDSLGEPFSANIPWSDIMTTFDGGYALTAFTIGRYDGIFIKLNHDLTTEFIKEYPDTINFVEYYRKIIETESSYILGGYLQRPNYQMDAFIRKVNKKGETIWFKYYGQYNKNDCFFNYTRLNDTLIAGMGGYWDDDFSTDGWGSWIALIDTNGNIVKEWKPDPTAPIDVVNFLMPVSGGKWLLFGGNSVDGPSTLTEAQSFLAVVDTTFQIENIRLVGPGNTHPDMFWDIEPTLDGNFIGAGETYQPGNNGDFKHGWLHKFTPATDSLWWRADLPYFQDTIPSESYFGGVGVLSSGNIIAGGNTTIGTDRFCWLVKVTPDGCIDTLWCATTPAWEPVEVNMREPDIQIYPNPAGDVLFVKTPAETSDLRITICTIDGRAVMEQALSPAGAVDVSGLPVGLYLMKAGWPNGKEIIRKMVVAR